MKIKNQLVQRQNLADAVVNRLQQQISLGQYATGEKLPSEPELMTQFGVGRSTIREAIRILANTGALSVRQGSGTYVESRTGIGEPLSQRLKRADKQDLDEVRQLLEMKIAEKAATHRTQKDIVKMRELLLQRAEAADEDDTATSIDRDIAFHISIAEASGNDILADLYKTFAQQMSRHFRETHQNTDSFIKTHPWHESLLDSIVDRDPKRAWQWAAKIAGVS